MTQRRIYQDEFPYFATTKTKEGIWFFDRTKCAKLLSNIIFQACRLKKCILYAYCIMPDHLHLLVGEDMGSHRTFEKVRWEPGEYQSYAHPQSTLSSVRSNKQYTISDLMQSIKGNFSRQVHQGNIWQPRFNTRIVDNEERLRNTLEYIKYNPKKASLPKKYQKFPCMYFNEKLIKSLL